MVYIPPVPMASRPRHLSRKQWARLLNCRRKVKIGSEAVAIRKAESRGEMEHYKCKVCDFWHLATKRKGSGQCSP